MEGPLLGRVVGLQLSAPGADLMREEPKRAHYPNVGLIAAVASSIDTQATIKGELLIELNGGWNGMQVDSIAQVLSLYYHVASAAAPFLKTTILLPHVSGRSLLRTDSSIDSLVFGQESKESDSMVLSILEERRTRALPEVAVEYVTGKKLESVREIIKGSEMDEEVSNPLFRLNGFRDVACGGTFDRLHSGHKVLLSAAAMLAQVRLVVGVSGGPLLQNKKFGDLLEPYSLREQNVQAFVSYFKPDIRCETVELADPFGPTITDPSLQALVVSDETKEGGDAINTRRKASGMSSMEVLSIHLVGAAASKLSSTWYREQESKKKTQSSQL